MRITYIHQHFRTPEEAGGGRPYEFARRLAQQQNTTVTIICGGDRSARYRVAGFDVVQVRAVYSNGMSFTRRLIAFAQFMLSASRAAAALNADVVLASSTPLTVAVPGIVAARVRRARFVLEVRDLWPTVPIGMNLLPRSLVTPALLLERVAYRAADHVIALSPWMADGVRAVDHKVPVTVVPNCADTGFAPKTGRRAVRAGVGVADDELLLYYAGSLGVSYDPDWLARLALAVRGTNARLIVVGEGAAEGSARKILADAGEDPDLTFVGRKSREAVFELGAAADIAVSSLMDNDALAHNSLNKVFDAFAIGRPLIFNHGGWLSDLAVERGAGWLWPRELDAGDAGSRIHALSADTLRAASAASLATGHSEFDRDDLFQRFQAVVRGTPTSL